MGSFVVRLLRMLESCRRVVDGICGWMEKVSLALGVSWH
jgi:hypothetical protein